MREDEELTPDIFNGMRLTSEEQAKVDMLRTNWQRQGVDAMTAFAEAEPGLFWRAMDHVFGREAVRDLLQQEMDALGMTRADLERVIKRKPH
jgi:hypothetical protein